MEQNWKEGLGPRSRRVMIALGSQVSEEGN